MVKIHSKQTKKNYKKAQKKQFAKILTTSKKTVDDLFIQREIDTFASTKKQMLMKMIGTTEDLIKANRKASREEEKKAKGGQLNFQHKIVTKNKKSRNRQLDRFDRKGKHKKSLPFLFSIGFNTYLCIKCSETTHEDKIQENRFNLFIHHFGDVGI